MNTCSYLLSFANCIKSNLIYLSTSRPICLERISLISFLFFIVQPKCNFFAKVNIFFRTAKHLFPFFYLWAKNLKTACIIQIYQMTLSSYPVSYSLLHSICLAEHLDEFKHRVLTICVAQGVHTTLHLVVGSVYRYGFYSLCIIRGGLWQDAHKHTLPDEFQQDVDFCLIIDIQPHVGITFHKDSQCLGEYRAEGESHPDIESACKHLMVRSYLRCIF